MPNTLVTHYPMLGFISTISNLLMGFGFFFRVFFPYNRIVRDYFINSNIVSLCLMGISISIYLQTKSVYLIAVFYGLFGWFQASLYPLALTLVNKKFSPEEDGCLLGFWSTSGDLGGVIGYLICTVIVYYIQAEWKLCLIVVPLLNIVVNFFFKGIL